MMVQINADKEEAEVVRVKVEAEEATANEKASFFVLPWNRFRYHPLLTLPFVGRVMLVYIPRRF